MKLRVIGVFAGSAINHVLRLCDGKTEEEITSLLLQNTMTDMPPENKIPPDFSKGKLVDIKVGELLGLGVAVAWHDILGRKNGDTYQAIIAVDNNSKRDMEVVLSDGAIWHNQTEDKMVYQQVTVQGYFPKRQLDDSDIVNAIQSKANRRSDYPNHCGLIVNVYSNKGIFDFSNIINNSSVDKFDVVLCIVYGLPKHKEAFVHYLNKDAFDTMPVVVKLDSFPRGTRWQINDNANK